MPAPLAYFLTWTTYGPWLHGDERGSVDDDNNRYERPTIVPDDARRTLAASMLSGPPLMLDEEARSAVDTAIRERCEFKHWVIRAVNVRSNHVHVVVSAGDETPERVMHSLKSWATRALRSHDPDRKQFWTRHGSTKYLWDEQSIHDACRYVLEAQDDSRRFRPDR